MGYDDTLREFRELVVDNGTRMWNGEAFLDEVRSVGIDYVCGDIKRPWEGYNKAALLRGFSKLEEVVLVLGKETQRLREMTGGKQGSEVVFNEVHGDPERSLRIWWEFKMAFVTEEKVLEEVCRDSGSEYEVYNLPVVRVREKTFVSR